MPIIPMWTERCEWGALLALAAAAFFIPVSISLMTAFCLIAVALYWLAGNWQQKWQIINNNPISYWVLGLFMLFLAGSIYTIASRDETISLLLRYGKFLLIPLLMPMFYQERYKNLIVNAFIVGVSFNVALSFCKIFGFPIINQSGYSECAFNEHIITSWVVAVAIFVLAHKLFSVKSIILRAVLISLITIFCIYLFGYNTGRSGVILFAVLLAVFFCQRFSFKFLLLGFITTIILFVSAYQFSNNFHSLVLTVKEHVVEYHHNKHEFIPTSEGLRLQFWSNSLFLIKSHPILGTGTGSFTKDYHALMESQGTTTYVGTNNPHNEYLFFGVQFGIFGMLFLLAWFLYLLYATKFLEPETRYSAQVFLISYIAGCLFNSWLRDGIPGYAFIIMVATFYGNLKFTSEKSILYQKTRGNKGNLVQTESK